MIQMLPCDNCGSTTWEVMQPGQNCNLCQYGEEDMCEYCGGCLEPNHPEACTCDGEDELDTQAHRTYFGR